MHHPKSFDSGCSERLLSLLTGSHIPCHFGKHLQSPNWLDRDLFKRGQATFKEYSFGIFCSNFWNLVWGFALPSLW
jgi:hypothetical protein